MVPATEEVRNNNREEINMPCNSDHMNPMGREIELSRVACLLDEIDGIPIDANRWRGYHPLIYGKSISKDKADRLVSTLCRTLQGADVTRYSLEMQIWWRDHQAADRERERREKEEAQSELDRRIAISKLTPRQRRALGIKDD